jgi:acetyl-CoA carboxylase biotin carboxylase subunit
VQRRHQKVIEETPCRVLGSELRRRLWSSAVESMRAIGYRGAGTVECVLTPEREFYFLEVNARLQVEHTITEVSTRVDLVEEQLRVASGDGISFSSPPARHGYAIEFRVYAEDPRTFLPSPGRISTLRFDLDPLMRDQARFDFGYDEGDEVPMFYDPLVGKVIAHDGWSGTTNAAAILGSVRIGGIKTNIPALLGVLEDERFVTGEYDTSLLGK